MHALAVLYTIVSCLLVVLLQSTYLAIHEACGLVLMSSSLSPCPCFCHDRRPCRALVHRRCRYVHHRLLLEALAPSACAVVSQDLCCKCHAVHATLLQDTTKCAMAAHAPSCFVYGTHLHVTAGQQEKHAGKPHNTREWLPDMPGSKGGLEASRGLSVQERRAMLPQGQGLGFVRTRGAPRRPGGHGSGGRGGAVLLRAAAAVGHGAHQHALHAGRECGRIAAGRRHAQRPQVACQRGTGSVTRCP